MVPNFSELLWGSVGGAIFCWAQPLAYVLQHERVSNKSVARWSRTQAGRDIYSRRGSVIIRVRILLDDWLSLLILGIAACLLSLASFNWSFDGNAFFISPLVFALFLHLGVLIDISWIQHHTQSQTQSGLTWGMSDREAWKSCHENDGLSRYGGRNLVGYADKPPVPKWPKGAKVALNFVSKVMLPWGNSGNDTYLLRSMLLGHQLRRRGRKMPASRR